MYVIALGHQAFGLVRDRGRGIFIGATDVADEAPARDGVESQWFHATNNAPRLAMTQVLALLEAGRQGEPQIGNCGPINS